MCCILQFITCKNNQYELCLISKICKLHFAEQVVCSSLFPTVTMHLKMLAHKNYLLLSWKALALELGAWKVNHYCE